MSDLSEEKRNMGIHKTKQVMVGNIAIGGGADISIQSMLNAPPDDTYANVFQAMQLETAGCEIIRTAVPNMDAVNIIYKLKEKTKMPVVADIHFDYRLALAAVDAGADKIRINPGNIGSRDNVEKVANACKEKGLPIRIGVNAGSLEKHLLKKYGTPCVDALVESALYNISLLEEFEFYDIIVSIKSSDVPTMFEAYKKLSSKCDYPLHLGVTEAGTKHMGVIKSAAGIGGLLLNGIGDTIRVSLTDDPVEEIYAARDILKAVGKRRGGPMLISCPTCGRTKIDLISLAKEVEQRLEGCTKDITVAVMGCEVNGPGEASHADIGIAGGKDCGVIIKKGEILRRVSQERLVDELMAEIDKM